MAAKFFCLILTATCAVVQAQTVSFRKLVLTERYYCDGITSGDMNSDGHTDVIAGPYWYAGPAFTVKHEIYPAEAFELEPSPTNSMYSFVHDFNADGHPDVLVLGRVHKHAAKWYQNPGTDDGEWKSHFVFERVRGESPALVDITGDGVPQLICHWDGCWGWIQPDAADPYLPWTFTAVGTDEDWPQFYHGEGVGDVNQDGRQDLIINDGWYEQPSGKSKQPWLFHRQRFSQERGGAQMFAYDVDADGDADVISAVHAHKWGLAWYEQDREGDEIVFHERLIMSDRSREKEFGAAFTQPHALALADIDADGLSDIVVGKRVWAHGPKGDTEPNAAPVLYWFQLTRTTDNQVQYVPHLIDDKSGVGVQVSCADVNGDGRMDVLTASKLGCFVFLNQQKLKQ